MFYSHILWHLHREQHPDMSGLLLPVFYGLHILGTALLCGADGSNQSETTLSTTAAASGSSEASSMTSAETLATVSSLATTSSLYVRHSSAPPPGPKYRTTRTTTTTTTTTTATTVTPNFLIYRKECLVLYMVSGGLILLCTVLLLSTLMLTWKVWRLSSRLKELSSNADLISNCEYWMGTAKKSKRESDAEAKGSSLLMADFSQAQEDVADGGGGGGATKGEDGKVNRDGQMEGDNKKVGGDTCNDEETPAGVDKKETPSSSKPQEDATNPQSSPAAAAAAAASSSSDGTEGPKVKV